MEPDPSYFSSSGGGAPDKGEDFNNPTSSNQERETGEQLSALTGERINVQKVGSVRQQ